MQKAQTYTVALTANQGAFAVHNNVSVVDSNGKEIKLVAFSDDSISFVAPQAGNYFLNVHVEGAPSANDSISYTLIGQQGVPIGTAKNDVMNGGDGADLLYGRGGNDTINGGTGRDIINGGTGKDVMVGGAGNDYYFVDNKGDVVKETSTLATEKDIVLSTVGFVLPNNVETLILVGTGNLTDRLAILGRGNQLDNTLIGDSTLFGANRPKAQDNETLRGGAGNDSLTNKNLGSSDTYEQELRHLFGESGNDTLTGYGQMVGGTGKDTYDIQGYARVEIAKGDSLPNSFDVIKGFIFGNTTTSTRLDLSSDHIAPDTGKIDGKNVGSIHSHHISKGLITFDDIDIYIKPLAITADKIADAIKYLQANITKPGDTVAFVAGHDTYVFQDGGSVDSLVQLVGIAADGIHNSAVKGSIFLV
uniref:calcium-binding protein n=1 Tax=Crenothrix polyspora TaxID=360316 RepID=UPI0015C626D5|nr:hypothetical protein [Crenothrix polyspora]